MKKALTTTFAILTLTALTITVASCDDALTEIGPNENETTEEIEDNRPHHLIGNFDIEGDEYFLQAQEATDVPIGMFSLFLDTEGATLKTLRLNLFGNEDTVQDLRLYLKNGDDTYTELPSRIEEEESERYLSFYGAKKLAKGSHTTFQIRGNINCTQGEYLRFRIRLKDVVLIGDTYGFNLNWNYQVGIESQGSAIVNNDVNDSALRILFSGFECIEPDTTP